MPKITFRASEVISPRDPVIRIEAAIDCDGSECRRTAFDDSGNLFDLPPHFHGLKASPEPERAYMLTEASFQKTSTSHPISEWKQWQLWESHEPSALSSRNVADVPTVTNTTPVLPQPFVPRLIPLQESQADECIALRFVAEFPHARFLTNSPFACHFRVLSRAEARKKKDTSVLFFRSITMCGWFTAMDDNSVK